MSLVDDVRQAAAIYAAQANASAACGDALLQDLFHLTPAQLINCFEDRPPYWNPEHTQRGPSPDTPLGRVAHWASDSMAPTTGPLFDALVRSPTPGPGPQFPEVPSCSADIDHGLHDWMLVGTATICTRCREPADDVRPHAPPPHSLKAARSVAILMASRPLEQMPPAEELAEAAGVPILRLSTLLEEFAFVYPDARRPHPETWQWGPGARCVFCCAPASRQDIRLCSWHLREQERVGILGDWQFHRLCFEGMDKHTTLQESREIFAPRCAHCNKSLVHISPGAVSHHRRACRAQATRGRP